MKTPEPRLYEKPSQTAPLTALEKMETIAYGVRARFEEATGYSQKITEATINVARSLGIPESAIEQWASRRFSQLAQDTWRLQEIKSILEKASGIPLAR